MIPTAGRTRLRHDHHRERTGVRGSPLAALGVLVAVCALALGLTSCGGTAQAGDAVRSADVTSWTGNGTGAGAQAVERQADAQQAAVTEAARTAAADAAERAAAGQAGGTTAAAPQGGAAAVEPGSGATATEPEQCTTSPEDRAACTMPEGAKITPGGGDVDGDGVFEEHEPVGPGYKDPRAYDGGPTSGETQCEWARQQGYGC